MTVRIDLPPKIDFGSAETLLADLKKNRGQDVTLDAKDVTRFGALGATTILVAVASWKADGQSLALENLSDDSAASLDLLGLSADMLTTQSEEPV